MTTNGTDASPAGMPFAPMQGGVVARAGFGAPQPIGQPSDLGRLWAFAIGILGLLAGVVVLASQLWDVFGYGMVAMGAFGAAALLLGLVEVQHRTHGVVVLLHDWLIGIAFAAVHVGIFFAILQGMDWWAPSDASDASPVLRYGVLWLQVALVLLASMGQLWQLRRGLGGRIAWGATVALPFATVWVGTSFWLTLSNGVVEWNLGLAVTLLSIAGVWFGLLSERGWIFGLAGLAAVFTPVAWEVFGDHGGAAASILLAIIVVQGLLAAAPRLSQREAELSSLLLGGGTLVTVLIARAGAWDLNVAFEYRYTAQLSVALWWATLAAYLPAMMRRRAPWIVVGLAASLVAIGGTWSGLTWWASIGLLGMLLWHPASRPWSRLATTMAWLVAWWITDALGRWRVEHLAWDASWQPILLVLAAVAIIAVAVALERLPAWTLAAAHAVAALSSTVVLDDASWLPELLLVSLGVSSTAALVLARAQGVDEEVRGALRAGVGLALAAMTVWFVMLGHLDRHLDLDRIGGSGEVWELWFVGLGLWLLTWRHRTPVHDGAALLRLLGAAVDAPPRSADSPLLRPVVLILPLLWWDTFGASAAGTVASVPWLVLAPAVMLLIVLAELSRDRSNWTSLGVGLLLFSAIAVILRWSIAADGATVAEWVPWVFDATLLSATFGLGALWWSAARPEVEAELEQGETLIARPWRIAALGALALPMFLITQGPTLLLIGIVAGVVAGTSRQTGLLAVGPLAWWFSLSWETTDAAMSSSNLEWLLPGLFIQTALASRGLRSAADDDEAPMAWRATFAHVIAVATVLVGAIMGHLDALQHWTGLGLDGWHWELALVAAALWGTMWLGQHRDVDIGRFLGRGLQLGSTVATWDPRTGRWEARQLLGEVEPSADRSLASIGWGPTARAGVLGPVILAGLSLMTLESDALQEHWWWAFMLLFPIIFLGVELWQPAGADSRARAVAAGVLFLFAWPLRLAIDTQGLDGTTAVAIWFDLLIAGGPLALHVLLVRRGHTAEGRTSGWITLILLSALGILDASGGIALITLQTVVVIRTTIGQRASTLMLQPWLWLLKAGSLVASDSVLRALFPVDALYEPVLDSVTAGRWIGIGWVAFAGIVILAASRGWLRPPPDDVLRAHRRERGTGVRQLLSELSGQPPVPYADAAAATAAPASDDTEVNSASDQAASTAQATAEGRQWLSPLGWELVEVMTAFHLLIGAFLISGLTFGLAPLVILATACTVAWRHGAMHVFHAVPILAWAAIAALLLHHELGLPDDPWWFDAMEPAAVGAVLVTLATWILADRSVVTRRARQWGPRAHDRLLDVLWLQGLALLLFTGGPTDGWMPLLLAIWLPFVAWRHQWLLLLATVWPLYLWWVGGQWASVNEAGTAGAWFVLLWGVGSTVLVWVNAKLGWTYLQGETAADAAAGDGTDEWPDDESDWRAAVHPFFLPRPRSILGVPAADDAERVHQTLALVGMFWIVVAGWVALFAEDLELLYVGLFLGVGAGHIVVGTQASRIWQRNLGLAALTVSVLTAAFLVQNGIIRGLLLIVAAMLALGVATLAMGSWERPQRAVRPNWQLGAGGATAWAQTQQAAAAGTNVMAMPGVVRPLPPPVTAASLLVEAAQARAEEQVQASVTAAKAAAMDAEGDGVVATASDEASTEAAPEGDGTDDALLDTTTAELERVEAALADDEVDEADLEATLDELDAKLASELAALESAPTRPSWTSGVRERISAALPVPAAAATVQAPPAGFDQRGVLDTGEGWSLQLPSNVLDNIRRALAGGAHAGHEARVIWDATGQLVLTFVPVGNGV